MEQKWWAAVKDFSLKDWLTQTVKQLEAFSVEEVILEGNHWATYLFQVDLMFEIRGCFHLTQHGAQKGSGLKVKEAKKRDTWLEKKKINFDSSHQLSMAVDKNVM